MLLHSLDYVRWHWFPLTSIYNQTLFLKVFFDSFCFSYNIDVRFTEHTGRSVRNHYHWNVTRQSQRQGHETVLDMKLKEQKPNKASWLEPGLLWSQIRSRHRTLAVLKSLYLRIWWQINVSWWKADGEHVTALTQIQNSGSHLDHSPTHTHRHTQLLSTKITTETNLSGI